MNSIIFRPFAIFFSFSILLTNFNSSFCQEPASKSGLFQVKRIRRGQTQEVQVINPRGRLQWQQSEDGINWFMLPGKITTSVEIVVNESLFLRCAIQEASCDRVFSDALLLIPFELATVTTLAVSEIQKVSAICGGNIDNDGGDPVLQRGVCWTLNQYPTIDDKKTMDGEGTSSYSSTLTGLTPGKLYYVRAYAINGAGTAYGNQVSFSTANDITLPSVITNEINNITTITAEGGGSVIHNGNATVTARGICWSTSQNPTLVDDKTSDGIGSGVFNSSLTGLTGNTTYYVRSYATNSAGTSYGGQVSFKTSPVLPEVTTTAVSSITQTTAASGGIITNDGGAGITSRGVCWSAFSNPTTMDRLTTDGTGSGVFTSSLTDLTGNTTYYLRAYATNIIGTSYGSEVSFITSPLPPGVTTAAVSDITQTTALSGGNITSDGGASITEKGVCWSTFSNPTTSGSRSTDGAGSGAFTSSMTGLTGNTAYYARAYATNSAGTSYGGQVIFITSPVLPTVTTTAISSITQTTASSGGNVTSDGGTGITDRGVCWSTSFNPTTADSKTTNGSGTGLFTSYLTGLSVNITYYVRAYATNSIGTSYGNEFSFKTSPELPMVTTASISSITQTTASSGGDVISDGGAAVLERGVCWNTTGTPTTGNNKTASGAGTGAFTSSLTGLTDNTPYYVRAYAINSAGTAYGNEVSFITLQSFKKPTVTTAFIWAITPTSATGGGNVTSDGGASITVRGVCWATDTDQPTTSHPHTTDGNDNGLFISNLTGLSENTRYFVRAYATNSAGTAYGDPIQFFTTAASIFGTFTDTRDNHVYQTVKIGTQTWMGSDLAYLPSVSPSSAGSETSPFYYVYSYEGSNVSEAKNNVHYTTYGALYNWPAALTACPSGWHLPSDAECTALSDFLGTSAGGKMKEPGTAHWLSPNTSANNSSGFTALPSGHRGNDGGFRDLSGSIHFWTSTEEAAPFAWGRGIGFGTDLLYRYSYVSSRGFSVRCLQN